jgi:beta-lactamase regulating signal transducer with metallopeptidase domain
VSVRNPDRGIGEQLAESIPLMWALGALSVLLWMVIGWMALQRIARRASPVSSAEWKSILEQERARAGVVARVALLTSESVSTPLTWGIRSPVILLPADATEWSLGHLSVVLRHELAHIARGDTLTQTLGVVACAVYWFNPLVWVAARGMRAEQERACDEQVLVSGTPPVEYAAHLLEVARSARALGPQGFVSLAMARPSQLEGRLLAVLNNSRRGHSTSPAIRRIGIALAGIGFVVLSAFTPISRAKPITKVVPASIIASQFVPPKSPIVEKKKEGSPVATTSDSRDSTFVKTVDASEGGTLDMDLDTGAGLTITSWDKPLIEVRGRLSGSDWRETEVELERTSSGARLTSRLRTRYGNTSTNHHFDIRLPRRYNIHVSSSGGGISISGVDGTFRGNTGGGEIRIEKANGRASITTGGGNIRVTNSNLSGSVSTGGGTVVIQDVRGGLTGSSGSSAPIYANSDESSTTTSIGIGRGSGKDRGIHVYDDGSITVSGPSSSITINDRTGEVRDRTVKVIFRKSGGRINGGEAMNGADVRTGGGEITIGRSAGDVVASTGGGDITIGPLSGSARVTTGAGDVRIDFTGTRSPSAEINSGNGRVIITLPSNFSGMLDLETAYTENHRGRTTIKSDWPLSLSETQQWENRYGTPRRFVRARQSFGNGDGVISVQTVNGDIEIRRR